MQNLSFPLFALFGLTFFVESTIQTATQAERESSSHQHNMSEKKFLKNAIFAQQQRSTTENDFFLSSSQQMRRTFNNVVTIEATTDKARIDCSAPLLSTVPTHTDSKPRLAPKRRLQWSAISSSRAVHTVAPSIASHHPHATSSSALRHTPSWMSSRPSFDTHMAHLRDSGPIAKQNGKKSTEARPHPIDSSQEKVIVARDNQWGSERPRLAPAGKAQDLRQGISPRPHTQQLIQGQTADTAREATTRTIFLEQQHSIVQQQEQHSARAALLPDVVSQHSSSGPFIFSLLSERRQWRPMRSDSNALAIPNTEFPSFSSSFSLGPLATHAEDKRRGSRSAKMALTSTSSLPLLSPQRSPLKSDSNKAEDGNENHERSSHKKLSEAVDLNKNHSGALYSSSLYYPSLGDALLQKVSATSLPNEDIAKSRVPIVDAAAPEPIPQHKPAAFTGQLVPSSHSSVTTPEYLKWPAPVEVEDFVPPPGASPQARLRYRAPKDRFFQSVSNDIIYDNWWTSWSHVGSTRSTSALVGNELGFFSGGIGLRDGVTEVNTGWRDVVVTEYTNRANQEVSLGAAKGRYGVFIDRSRFSQAAAVEVLARNVGASTLVDFVDRDYGVRINVRNFDISIRHDFDEFSRPDPKELATEVLIAFRGVGMALSTDVADKRYGFTVGVRGRQISILHDFDERESEVLVNWGRGWQTLLQADLIDPYSQNVYTRLGVGRLGRAYFAVGGGVGADGVPEVAFETQLPDVGLFMRFIDLRGTRQLQTAVTIGKFTYIWESSLALQNLRVPNLFGLDPDQVKHFLLGRAS